MGQFPQVGDVWIRSSWPDWGHGFKTEEWDKIVIKSAWFDGGSDIVSVVNMCGEKSYFAAETIIRYWRKV